MSYIQRRKSNYKTSHNQYRFFGIINRIGKRNRRKQNKYERKNKYSRLIQNILQFSIVILQGILVFVTWRLVESAKEQSEASYAAAIATQQSAEAVEKSVDISEQSLEIQERSMKIVNRAYISVLKIEPTNIDDFSKTPVKIKFLNSGQTPAYKGENRTHIYLAKKPCMGLIKPFPEQVISEMVIGRNGVFSINNDRTFPEKQINLIRNKKEFINIIGIVDYIDVFKQTQWLKYQLYYNVDAKEYTYCKEHNDAS